MQNEIVFEHVSFSYEKRKIFENLNLSIPLDQNVALVGENGAGKSTLIKLLLNLHSPQRGTIRIGDKKTAELTAKEQTDLFAVAYQDFYRYPLSLRENLSLCMDKTAGDSQCSDALRRMGIESLTGKLDCRIGKYGQNSIELSDGQWQKIVLARTLLSPARLLILDEPTASLDPISESNLYDNFMRVMQSHGTLIVTHRMALTRFADMVIVLKDGRVGGAGRHEDLLRQNSYYRTLYEKQSEWYV